MKPMLYEKCLESVKYFERGTFGDEEVKPHFRYWNMCPNQGITPYYGENSTIIVIIHNYYLNVKYFQKVFITLIMSILKLLNNDLD
jgi:hypothetical protein